MCNSFSERLTSALKLRRMSPSALSEASSIGKSSISEYMSGRYEPKQQAVYLMAKALRVNPVWLLGYDVPAELEAKEVPVLTRIPAGRKIVLKENIEGYKQVSVREIDYALRASDDSMIGARIFAGDLVFAEAKAGFQNGDLVIASIPEADAVIRRYYKYGPKVILHPENPTIKDLEYESKDVKILGKVREVSFRV